MKIHTVQLNLADLIGGTMHMDNAEFGAYCSLFLSCYNISDYRLPIEDSRLARIARCSPKTWARIRETVLKKFKRGEEDGIPYFYHERVLRDILKYKSISTINRDNALIRWESEMRTASDSHSERNATQHPLSNKGNYNLPTSKPRGGVVKNGDNLGKDFDMLKHLDETTIQAARKSAPGWDVYNLAAIYNRGVQKRGIPEKPGKAFPAWCAKYTKGKSP